MVLVMSSSCHNSEDFSRASDCDLGPGYGAASVAEVSTAPDSEKLDSSNLFLLSWATQ